MRLHGRGGLGLKTAGRVLGSALFIEGFEVQDAPLYGAERRGAPMLAQVRASHRPINERGIVRQPDLLVISDSTLIGAPAAGVLAGIREETVLLIATHESAETWNSRLGLAARVVSLTLPDGVGRELVGTACAAGAARLLGVIARGSLERALRLELAMLGATVVEANLETALDAFEQLAPFQGSVREGPEIPVSTSARPEWIDLTAESALQSAPSIHVGRTSVLANTGAWRVTRPVIDDALCHRCQWVCSTACPDGAIGLRADGAPIIDLDHCKGCMICVAECPWHAIRVELEQPALGQAKEGRHGSHAPDR